MDPLVLKRVAGRYFDTMRRQPGALKNFKRVKVKGAHYPAIIKSNGDEVQGIVVSGITSDELARLDEFEDDQYERKNIVVGLLNGRKINATAYVAGIGMSLDDDGWDLADWQCFHRKQFLAKLGL